MPPKSVSQYIIDCLFTGAELNAHDISEMVDKLSGGTSSSANMSSQVGAIYNPKKCDLGYFITREKKDDMFTYRLVPEILQVPIEKIYSLARKTGKDRYTLEQAVAEYPELQPYVKTQPQKNKAEASVPAVLPTTQTNPEKSASFKSDPRQYKPLKLVLPEDLNIDLNLTISINFAGFNLGGSGRKTE